MLVKTNSAGTETIEAIEENSLKRWNFLASAKSGKSHVFKTEVYNGEEVWFPLTENGCFYKQ